MEGVSWTVDVWIHLGCGGVVKGLKTDEMFKALDLGEDTMGYM